QWPRGGVFFVVVAFPTDPGFVVRVGIELPVVGPFSIADRHELLSPRELVDVDQEFLGRLDAPFLAAVDRIGLPLLCPGIVEVPAESVRDGKIRLLNATEHLLVELLLKRHGPLHDRVRVGVLRLEVREDVRIRLLPQPEIGVRRFSRRGVSRSSRCAGGWGRAARERFGPRGGKRAELPPPESSTRSTASSLPPPPSLRWARAGRFAEASRLDDR